MSLADLKGARLALWIGDLGDQHVYLLAQRDHFLGQAGPEDSGQALVKRLTVPPAVHIGFPESERAGRQNPAVKLRIMDMDVPRTVSVNLNIRLGEEILHGCLAWPGVLALSAEIKNQRSIGVPRKGRRVSSVSCYMQGCRQTGA